MPKSLIAQAQKHLVSYKDKLDYKGFLKTFFEKVPKEDLISITPQSMAYTAQQHLRLAHQRPIGDKPAIAIYTAASDKEGWEGDGTIIDIVNDDMAFLVDSVVAEVIRQQHNIATFIHPVLWFEKDRKNKIKNIYAEPKDTQRLGQSHIHIKLDRVISAEQIKDMEKGLKNVLSDTRYANRDWHAMREKLQETVKTIETASYKCTKSAIAEYQKFITYLCNDNFTLLGYREYSFHKKENVITSKIRKGKSLGLLGDEIKPVYVNEARKSLTEAQQKLRLKQEPVTISKVNKRSTVHRRVPLDAIAIKEYDSQGNVKKERLFLGLFTSVTYSRSVTDIPYLRMKVENVIKKARYAYASHNYKALKHILEKYPRDEILQMSEDLLYKHSTSILRLQERPQIALFTRTDPFGRYISCLAYIPREKFETRLRLKIQDILEQELGGVCNNHKVLQDDAPLARVLYQIDINARKSVPKFDANDLEHKVIHAGLDWTDHLISTLEDKIKNPAETSRLISQYKNAFPISYQEHYHPAQAVLDIHKISSIIDGDAIELELYDEKNARGELEIHLKLYHAQTPLTLSDVLPIMENMGLNVITEVPSEIQPRNYKDKIWIHDFLLEPINKNVKIDIKKTKSSFEDVFKKTWGLEVENDSLNMLAFYAQMPWHDVAILRTYIHYYKQTGSAFSLPYMESAITTYPDIGQKIVTLFKDIFNPDKNPMSDKQKKARITAVHHALDKVSSLDHDRILRAIASMIGATLRTNFFQKNGHGEFKNYLSIKLDSGLIEELPEPKPYREIFVYSARTEGIHLRGDKIARGGLRWSDRHEDFRTEVLGLMKAQQVKNAIIVPMGAKGGFVVKNPPTNNDRNAIREEGICCYKVFIRGLLDITDNRKGKSIIPPQDVVRYDSDDPYLVVAADKGTASFSDIANDLSKEYGFWLGDAFASGGSAGYDHKKMGITARGAWESVKRHFRELNHDTQTQDFDVIGVGDMGGDVFGNGMLLSEHICLVGAFNHLHIFCDPNPDPAKSYKERQKLFDEVKGWDAYNTKILSNGGRIYSRHHKSLELTPEIQKRFNITDDKVSPNRLIRAMLLARTDLLWFGGIGTYIKASDETHLEVGDKGNDILRINAKDLKAKVIGEGANLALTQQARIEYAQHGGCLNADYIDNAGGVASSDDEVNIKIVLGDVMRKSIHKMDIKKRNKLLESMTDSVSQHVLRGCYQQAQGISLMELKAASNITAHGRVIKYLEDKIGLNRELEELPTDEEIKERKRVGKGLTRPELSILQSYAKISYTEDLLASDIPENKAMEERLFRYFPSKLQKSYQKEILDHRLKREIIATTLAGGIVNRMGPDFILEMMNRCGSSCEDVAKAYIIVREAFGLRHIWNEIESLDGKVSANIQLHALHETARMIKRTATWLLTRYGRKLDIKRDISHFEGGIKAVKDNLDEVVPKELLTTIKQLTQNGVNNGLPKALSRNISLMPVLGSACDIIRISVDHKFEIPITARVYFELGDHFHLDWMRQKARHMPADTHWAAQALQGLVDQLYTCQAGLTVRILKDMGKAINQGPKKSQNDIGCIGCESVLTEWVKDRGSQAKLLEPLFVELRRNSSLDLSMLIIAEQRLRNLYGG